MKIGNRENRVSVLFVERKALELRPFAVTKYRYDINLDLFRVSINSTTRTLMLLVCTVISSCCEFTYTYTVTLCTITQDAVKSLNHAYLAQYQCHVYAYAQAHGRFTQPVIAARAYRTCEPAFNDYCLWL